MPPRGRGNVRVYIDGDSSGLGRATKQAETYVGGLGSRITTAGDKMASAGGKLTRGVTLPVVGLGIAAGKVAVDFDKAMRNVNSIAQLPEPQLEKLEGKVLDLGGKTAQAPRTLAEGLYDLVSSGFDAKESIGILGKSAKAATAGLTTTEVSTAAVAAELNAYHLPARKAGEISDQLFETVNRGVITFEDLATNIGDVLPFASSLDVGMEEVGASISTMTKEGIQAPETMTRIKNVMVSLLKPGEDLGKAIKQTGFESGEALVKQKGFQGGLEALVGTTDGSKESIAELFPNIRALGGVLALTGKNTASAREDLAAFSDTSGATAKALKEQSKSAAYQVNELKAELQAAAIEAAPPFLEAGKEIVGTLGSMAEGFSELPDATKTSMIKVALAGAALGPLLTIGGNLVKVYGGVISTFDKVALSVRNASAAQAASAMTPYGQMPIPAPEGRAINLAQSGIGAAKGFAKGLAVGLAPAVAAAGLGNVIVSAASGDVKDAGFKMGGALAGGIAGAFIGGPAGAAIGAGIGSFVGGALSGLFDSEQKLNPMQARLKATADATAAALHRQAGAARSAERAGDRLRQANHRHRKSTDAAEAAQGRYQNALRKFGPDSLPALRAALNLARAERQEANAADEAKRAHKFHGVQLELYKEQTARAIAAENRRIPILRRTVNSLTHKWRGEKDNVELGNRLQKAINSLNGAEGKRSRLLTEAASRVNPKWAQSLERMGQGVSRFIGESGKLRRQLESLPRTSQTTTDEIARNWKSGGELVQAIRNFKGETKRQLNQGAGKYMKAFQAQGAGAFGELAQSVYGADKNIATNTEGMLRAFNAAEMPAFRLQVPSGAEKGPGYAQGGAVRVPGGGMQDTVALAVNGAMSAMVAPGEDLVVFNRHQRPLIDRAVANEYGVAGLGGFFDAFDRPHYMAKGGPLVEPRVTGPDPLGGIGRAGVHRSFQAAQAYIRSQRPKGGYGNFKGASGRYPGVSGDTDFLPALGMALSHMAEAAGTSISVTSGWRSRAEQAALYQAYLEGRGNLAAPPGSSDHESGRAADISPGREVFGSMAGRYGLGFTVPGESWHIELLARGGVAQQSRFSPFEERVQRVAGRAWNKAAHLFGRSANDRMPMLYIAKGLHARSGHVGEVRSSAGRYGHMVYLDPRWAGRLANGADFAEGALLHEWAHVFQKDGLKPWEREGGATQFQRYASPIAFGNAPGLLPIGYRRFAERVVKEKGWPWVRRGQFRARGGVVSGRVSWFNGPSSTTASGTPVSRPGLALNLKPGTDAGWDNATTRGWMEAAGAGHPVYGRTTIAGHTANLPIIDLGPAGSTGRAIDVTEAGVRKLGMDPANFPTDSIGKVKILGEAGTGKSAGGAGSKRGRARFDSKSGGMQAPRGAAKGPTTEAKRPPLGAGKVPAGLASLGSGISSLFGGPGMGREERFLASEAGLQIAEQTPGREDDEAIYEWQLGVSRTRKKAVQKEIARIDRRLAKERLTDKQRRKLMRKRRDMVDDLGTAQGRIGSARGSLEELRPTRADYADLNLARAEGTADKADDIVALQELVGIAEQELRKAEQSGDPREIAEATRNLNSAADALRDALPTASDYANRDLALAELTEGLDDDRAALERLKQIAEEQLKAAFATADPRDDIEAAQNLKSVNDSLKSLDETIAQQNDLLRQREDFEKERLAIDKKLVALAEAQGPAFMAAFARWIDGAIGGPVSQRLGLPTTPGVAAGYQ